MQVRPTLPNIVYVLFRHKWAMVLTVLAVMVGAGAYCLFATEYFEAQNDLYVKFGHDTTAPVNAASGIGPAQAALDQQNILNSLIAMLTSESLVEEVINEIGLKTLYPRIVASPPWFGTPLGAAARRMVKRDLTVQVARNANIIQVIYDHPDAKLAARTANLLVQKFITRELALLRDPQSSFLEQQLQQYRKTLVDAEAALDQFRNQTGISSLDEERTLLLKRRTDLETSIASNEAQVTALVNRREVLHAELQALPANVQFSDESDTSQSQLIQLQVQRQALLNNYRPESEVVRNIDRQIQKLAALQSAGNTRVKKEMPSVSHQDIEVDLNRVQAELHGLQEAQQTLEQQHAAVVRRLAALDTHDTRLQDLERQYQIADLNYRTYYQNYEQARIAEELNKQKITTISVIQTAIPPDRSTYPKDYMILPISAGIGLVLACLIAFFREGFDERLNLPLHVEDALKLGVLASMPRLKEAGAE
jgi:uncharacterized protein involved in exopolysaccharide biosynthesis